MYIKLCGKALKDFGFRLRAGRQEFAISDQYFTCTFQYFLFPIFFIQTRRNRKEFPGKGRIITPVSRAWIYHT
jgi:hypothetical protein